MGAWSEDSVTKYRKRLSLHNSWFCRYKNSPYGTSGASPYEAWLHFQHVSEKDRTLRDK